MHQTSARKKNRRTISALQTTRAIVTQRFRSPVRRQAGRARTEPAPVTAPLIALHLSVILHTGHTHPRHRFLKPPGYTTNCKHEGFPSFPCLPTSSTRCFEHRPSPSLCEARLPFRASILFQDVFRSSPTRARSTDSVCLWLARSTKDADKAIHQTFTGASYFLETAFL